MTQLNNQFVNWNLVSYENCFQEQAFEKPEKQKQEAKIYPFFTKLCMGHIYYGKIVGFLCVLRCLIVFCSHLIWQATTINYNDMFKSFICDGYVWAGLSQLQNLKYGLG